MQARKAEIICLTLAIKSNKIRIRDLLKIELQIAPLGPQYFKVNWFIRLTLNEKGAKSALFSFGNFPDNFKQSFLRFHNTRTLDNYGVQIARI